MWRKRLLQLALIGFLPGVMAAKCTFSDSANLFHWCGVIQNDYPADFLFDHNWPGGECPNHVYPGQYFLYTGQWVEDYKQDGNYRGVGASWSIWSNDYNHSTDEYSEFAETFGCPGGRCAPSYVNYYAAMGNHSGGYGCRDKVQTYMTTVDRSWNHPSGPYIAEGNLDYVLSGAYNSCTTE